ncbi:MULTISPECIES: hypothetical protein [Helicobacter]|uniref:hypothetical protein n=1 Tax=Helicobacter TaxID=209 RepID=UPI00058FC3F3|nr:MULTISPECIES: hypothetical protein [Helicobacter]
MSLEKVALACIESKLNNTESRQKQQKNKIKILNTAESSTQKYIKQDPTTHSNTSKKTLSTPKSLNP